ncbi:hypothetical protein LJC46_06240 [Desulfovibrio sp. OttesenSCG-928-G15]|nr:hypothetical protein [Desulfovibrio sp. OttesenSCG-928-G15]
MKLKELAHARAGDKGNTCNICVIPYAEEHYPLLKELLTAERVREYFAEFCQGRVIRYEVDSIGGLNFVLEKALFGGVTRSLAVDKHGKSLGMALLEMEIGATG